MCTVVRTLAILPAFLWAATSAGQSPAFTIPVVDLGTPPGSR
jgi:hypothetical protein